MTFKVVLFLALGGPLAAQIGGSGSITGVVTDPAGAVIPGATVEALNSATGVRTARTTTAAGYFVVAPLPAGDYTVRVSAGGFQTLIPEPIIVDALSATSFNPAMRIGASTEQVTISAAPPELDTSDASISQTIRNEVYTALPLTMGTGGASINSPRDPTSFVQFMPGVSGYGGNTAGRGNRALAENEEGSIDELCSNTDTRLRGERRTALRGR